MHVQRRVGLGLIEIDPLDGKPPCIRTQYARVFFCVRGRVWHSTSARGLHPHICVRLRPVVLAASWEVRRIAGDAADGG